MTALYIIVGLSIATALLTLIAAMTRKQKGNNMICPNCKKQYTHTNPDRKIEISKGKQVLVVLKRCPHCGYGVSSKTYSV
jgi:C4-type Zn-finger protein